QTPSRRIAKSTVTQRHMTTSTEPHERVTRVYELPRTLPVPPRASITVDHAQARDRDILLVVRVQARRVHRTGRSLPPGIDHRVQRRVGDELKQRPSLEGQLPPRPQPHRA